MAAKQLVVDKIFNQRVFLRRHNDEGVHDRALRALKRMMKCAAHAKSAENLRGFEGNAARIYWKAYGQMIENKDPAFAMDGRNRRPPRDRTNAMLSYMYGMLMRSCTIAVQQTGLDPHLGIYHTPQAKRASMALDLMEPFRPLIVDSAVHNLISRGSVSKDDFTVNTRGVRMKKPARTAVIRGFEQRMHREVKHPLFSDELSYQRIVEFHARRLRQFFQQDIDEPPCFKTR